MIGQIRVDGMDAVVFDLQQYGADVERRVSLEMEASCLAIVRTMKQLAPTNQGRLKQGCTYVKHSSLDFEIISAAAYSAYMEFGTKSMVKVPAGYEEFANTFKGIKIDSGGLSAKAAIFAWAKQKGIDEKYWYPIFVKLITKGARPHPFLIPALILELPKLEKRISKIINSAA